MLTQAEANLAALIESTADLIWSVDLDYRIIASNCAFRENIENNYGSSVLTGMRPEEYLPPEKAALWPPLYEQALREGPFRTEYLLVDGRTLEMALNPIVMDGQVAGISVFGKDITERKASDCALRQAEEARALLASIVDASTDLIHAVNLDGSIASWNPGAERLTGYTSEEILGKSVKVLAPPGHEEAVEQTLLEIAAGSAAGPFDTVLRRKDGSGVDVALTLSPIRDAAGVVTGIAAIAHDITIRRQSAEALHESGDFLTEAQRIGDLGCYVMDVSTGVWSSTSILDEIFGIDPEYERTVTGWEALVHPDDRAMMSAYFTGEVIGKGKPFDKEYRILRKRDGSERWVHGLGKLEMDAEGNPRKMRGIIRDITRHRRWEMELQHSEALYRTAFQTSIDAVTISHLEDGRFVDVNQAFLHMFGYQREEVVGHTSLELKIWTDLADRKRLVERLRKEAPVRDMEFLLAGKGGRRFWVLVSGAQIEIQGVPSFLLVVRDISESKAAARRLTEAQEALRMSEERHRIAFQASANIVAMVRLDDGVILDANKAFLETLGYEQREAIGHSWQDLGFLADAREMQTVFETLRRNREFRGEVRIGKKNGEVFWGRMSASVFEYAGVSCFLAVTQDITEGKIVEQRLVEADKALRASEERYRTAFQTSIDAININRLSDGKYIDCNQAFLDILGYQREEVIGRTSLELEVWADSRDRHTMSDLVRQSGSCRGLEVQFKKKNGELMWGQMSATMMEVDGVPCVLSISRDLSESKAAKSEIQNLAYYDSLTGLPNRRLLLERLQMVLASESGSSRSQALLLIDLDNFKTLNDRLGHQTGDLLLQLVARRISDCTQETDTVGRLGSDEFVVMLEDLSVVAEEAAAQAQAVGEKILVSIAQPYLLKDRECLSTASIGIAVFRDQQNSSDEILQQVDIALHQAKAAGHNTMRFFSPALQAAVNARATLEEDLRRAIKTQQFLLYYQPQVEQGRLIGVEALIRWKHPVNGLVAPDEFIPLAEESKLILPLGNWVLETACAQIARWAKLPKASHLTVAVNISALQFRQPEFVEHVLKALDRTGANPKNLKLELTESMLVENFEDVISKMSELKSHGLSFSLDDFGTGYSSLAYLKRLPLDQLKIDRVFVRDMLVDATSGAIAQTIISLGRAMGLSVIAEGVESEEQRGFLAGLGCHCFQGMLYSPPLPLEDFEAFF
jgi:diguanylate cyclase (GGDEF)-like protein/PAS domain S-box-containing protein